MYLIYISGIDGCGKTTQAKLLTEWMNAQGLRAEYHWLRWEPSILRLIKTAKRLLTKRSSVAWASCPCSEDRNHPAATDPSAFLKPQNNTGETESFNQWVVFKRRLFSSILFQKLWLAYAARDYYRAYRQAAATWQADYVILDRYLFDFVVDQSLNFGMSIAQFERLLESTILGKMRKPDLRVFIDLPAEVGYYRKMDGTPLAYLQKREACYEQVPPSDSVLHVDGKKPMDEIHGIIRQWLVGKLRQEK